MTVERLLLGDLLTLFGPMEADIMPLMTLAQIGTVQEDISSFLIIYPMPKPMEAMSLFQVLVDQDHCL